MRVSQSYVTCAGDLRVGALSRPCISASIARPSDTEPVPALVDWEHTTSDEGRCEYSELNDHSTAESAAIQY